MIPSRTIPNARVSFDPSSGFLHVGGVGTRHVFLDLEQGVVMDFGRELEAGCWSGPGEAAVSSPGGFELHDLRSRGGVRTVATPDPVKDLWSSEDGGLLLVVSGTCRIWHRAKGDWQAGAFAHPGRPRYATFSPDGAWLLTIDDEAGLRVFPTTGDSPEPNFDSVSLSPGTASFEAFLPRFTEDSSAVYVKADGALVTIDARTGEVLARNGPAGAASDVTPDGGLMVTVRGLLEGSNSTSLFSRFLGASFFTPGGSAIFSSHAGEMLDLDGRRLGVIPFAGRYLAQSPDGTLLAFPQRDSVMICRVARAEPYIDVPGPADGRLALDDAETVFASAGMATIHEAGRFTRAYRVEDGQPAGPETDVGHQLLCAAFLADGRFVAGCRRDAIQGRGQREDVGGPGLLRAWDLASGQPSGEPLALPAEPWAVERSPDDSWIAVLARDGSILRVDPELRNAEELLRLPSRARHDARDEQQGYLKFSDDGSRLYANGLGPNTWAIDLKTRRILFDTGHGDSSAFSIQLGKGLLFAPTAHNGQQWLFDAEDGAVVPLPDDERPFCPVGSKLHPDGRRLLLSGRPWVSVVDWTTGKRLGSRYYPTRVRLAYSDFVPGTPWIFTAANTPGEPSSLALWDPRSGMRLNPDWPIRDAEVTDLRTTRDGGHTIISQRGLGHRIVLWDEIRRREEWRDGLDPADRRFLAELQASRRLIDGSVVPLDNDLPWHAMWREFDARHPRFLDLRPPRDELIRWHRNREVRFRESRPTTAAWHRARLKELEVAGG
jgi:WD40 repeat protein